VIGLPTGYFCASHLAGMVSDAELAAEAKKAVKPPL